MLLSSKDLEMAAQYEANAPLKVILESLWASDHVQVKMFLFNGFSSFLIQEILTEIGDFWHWCNKL